MLQMSERGPRLTQKGGELRCSVALGFLASRTSSHFQNPHVTLHVPLPGRKPTVRRGTCCPLPLLLPSGSWLLILYSAW